MDKNCLQQTKFFKKIGFLSVGITHLEFLHRKMNRKERRVPAKIAKF